MTTVDNTVQRKLKFKITTKGIREATDQKTCEKIVKVILNGANNLPEVKTLPTPSTPANCNKRKPESTHYVQREKKQKLDRVVRQQCSNILKSLMMHQAGYLFNQPVNPVELNIPDYFSIISQPMDLGTIKRNLEGNIYYSVEEFSADVRLTFSNAMLYNPPGNFVHEFAKELNSIFSKRWKLMEAKLKRENKIMEQETGRDSKQTVKKNGLGTKTLGINKVASCVNVVTKRPMPLELKQKLKLELLEISRRKMADDIRDVLRNFGLIGLSEEKLGSYFDAADDDTLWKLKREMKSIVDKRAVEAGPAKLQQNVIRISTKSVQKAKCASCGSTTCHCGLKNASSRASSSDLSSERSSEHDHCGDSKLDFKVKYPLSSYASSVGQDSNGPEVVPHKESSPRLSIPASTANPDEGWASFNVPLSPKKALRAAMLKSRFADTIFKATHQTLLDQGDKSDPARVQQEKEKLHRQQLEEQRRIEAEIKAAEEASRMRMQAELKERRETEREAARIALQKMEKTVELNESQEFLKDLEMMISDSPSSQGSFGGNPLERLGLYFKDDYMEEEEEEEEVNEEEGEILP